MLHYLILLTIWLGGGAWIVATFVSFAAVLGIVGITTPWLGCELVAIIKAPDLGE